MSAAPPWRLVIRRGASGSGQRITLGEEELEWLFSSDGQTQLRAVREGRPEGGERGEADERSGAPGLPSSRARSRSVSVSREDSFVPVFVRSFLHVPTRLEQLHVRLDSSVHDLRVSVAAMAGAASSEVILCLGTKILLDDGDRTFCPLHSWGLRKHSEVVATRRVPGGADDDGDSDRVSDTPGWVCRGCLNWNRAGLECATCGSANPFLENGSSDDEPSDEVEMGEPDEEVSDTELLPAPAIPPVGPVNGVAVLGMDGTVWLGEVLAEPAGGEVAAAAEAEPEQEGIFGFDEETGVPRVNGHVLGPPRIRVSVDDLPGPSEPMAEFSYDNQNWFVAPDPFAPDGGSSDAGDETADGAHNVHSVEIGNPGSLAAFLAANAIPAEGYPGRSTGPLGPSSAARSQAVPPGSGAASSRDQVRAQRDGDAEALLRRPPGGGGDSSGGSEP